MQAILFALLAAIVIAALRTYHRSADSKPPNDKRTNELALILACCAVLLGLWYYEFPRLVGFLLGNPWSYVLLGFFVWFARKLGAESLKRWILRTLLLASVSSIVMSFKQSCTGMYRSTCPLPEEMQPKHSDDELLASWREKGIHHFISSTTRETTFFLNRRDTLLLARPIRSDLVATSHGDTTRYQWIKDSYIANGYKYLRRTGIDTATITVFIGTEAERETWLAQYRPQKRESSKKETTSSLVGSQAKNVVADTRPHLSTNTASEEPQTPLAERAGGVQGQSPIPSTTAPVTAHPRIWIFPGGQVGTMIARTANGCEAKVHLTVNMEDVGGVVTWQPGNAVITSSQGNSYEFTFRLTGLYKLTAEVQGIKDSIYVRVGGNC